MMRRHFATACAAVALATVVQTEPAQQSRDFAVPTYGVLRLSVPAEWSSESKPINKPAAAAIHLWPKARDTFDIQITVVGLDAEMLKKMTAESLKASTAATGKSLASQSVEKIATLKELSGAQSAGWYYTLTDSNPAPGEFKYMTQGSFLAGQLLCAFTVLHRDSNSPEAALALKAFVDAVQVK